MLLIRTVDANEVDTIINIERVTHVHYHPHPPGSNSEAALVIYFRGNADSVRIVQAEAERVWDILSGLVSYNR